MMRSFVKDFFSISISKFAVIAFGICQSIITARWLGPSGNGLIAGLAVYPAVFMNFGSLGVSQAATHFIGNGKIGERTLKSSILQIWMINSVLTTVASFFLIRYFSNSGNNLLWVLLAILPLPFALFNNYNSGIYLGKNQIRTYNKINWLPSAVTFLAMVLFLVVLNMSITGALVAAATGVIFMFILLLFKERFIESFTLKFNWAVIAKLLSLGILYAISLLIISLNYKINVILLDRLSTPFELGIYAKGAAITEYLWQIPTFLSTIVFARSANAKDGLLFSRKVTQLLRLSIIAIGIGSLLLIIFSRFIILLLYGQAFALSIEVLQFLVPGVVLLTIYKVLNMDLAGKGKPWIAIKAMLPSLLINIILNIFLIPKYGASGAAFTGTVTYSFAAVLFIHFYSKEVKLPVKEILKFSKSDFEPVTSIIKKIKFKMHEGN